MSARNRSGFHGSAEAGPRRRDIVKLAAAALFSLGALPAVMCHPAAAGHRDRAHQARQPAAERQAWTHAPHPQAGDDPPTGHEYSPAAGRIPCFHQRIQCRTPTRGARHGLPEQLYAPSPRPYQGLPEIEYPFHDRDILVTACGRICIGKRKINLSTVFAGQRLGIKEVDDGIWLVSFMHYDLGYIDLEQKTLQTIDNPFGTRLSPMS
jgi:hypothetical protein